MIQVHFIHFTRHAMCYTTCKRRTCVICSSWQVVLRPLAINLMHVHNQYTSEGMDVTIKREGIKYSCRHTVHIKTMHTRTKKNNYERVTTLAFTYHVPNEFHLRWTCTDVFGKNRIWNVREQNVLIMIDSSNSTIRPAGTNMIGGMNIVVAWVLLPPKIYNQPIVRTAI